MGKIIDLNGKKFGRLTIIRLMEYKRDSKAVWLCRCDCGNEKEIIGKHLRNGSIVSCGCFGREKRIEANTTHGMVNNSSVYNTWIHIKDRCLNPKNPSYKYYGGRGITICNEWINDFKVFYDYIGEKPSPKHSLDRFPDNKSGHYEPGNVRWATSKQQMANMRRNVILYFNNKKMILAEFARLMNVNKESVRRHLKLGRTPEQIASHYKYKKDNDILVMNWRSPSD